MESSGCSLVGEGLGDRPIMTFSPPSQPCPPTEISKKNMEDNSLLLKVPPTIQPSRENFQQTSRNGHLLEPHFEDGAEFGVEE